MSNSFTIPQGVTIYLDKPYVKLFYDKSNEVLMCVFKGFSTVEEVEAICIRMLQAVNIESAKKVLYDTRLLEVLDEVSEKYISTTYTSKIIEAGVKYSATVIPKDIFAQLSVDNIQKRHSKFEYRGIFYFESFSKALKWLSNK